MKKQMNYKFTRLLKRLEVYTKTDMVYLARGSFWLSLAQVSSSIAGFLLTFILANKLSATTLGEYRLLITGFTIMSIVALPGMRTALRESTPKGYKGNLRFAFRKMFLWGLASAIISLFVSVYYYLHSNTTLSIGFLFIAIAIPFYNAGTAYLEYLTALKKVRQTTIYTVTTKSILVTTVASAVFLFPNYAWAVLAAFLFGTLLPNLCFHFKTVKELTTPTDKADTNITKYAMHITAMTASGLLAGQLDKIFIWKIVGAAGLASFYIAYTVPLTISQYLIIIPTLAFAKFGEKEPAVIRRTLMPKILKYTVAISFLMLVYIVAAPTFFEIFFPKYIDAIAYSQILALIPIFGGFLPLKTYLTSLKKTRNLYIISIIPPAIRILVAITLIGPFGVWGAIFSLLAENLATSILLVLFFLKTPKHQTSI